MYTAMIVEADPRAREALAASVYWSGHGVGRLLYAADGAGAAALLVSECIDILVTDTLIGQPGPNGLELLAAVRRTNCDAECIILTADESAETARAALAARVGAYLLKPASAAALDAAVADAAERLTSGRFAAGGLRRVNLLQRWVCGGISMDDLRQRAPAFGIDVDRRNYAVVCIRPGNGSVRFVGLLLRAADELGGGTDLYAFWDTNGYYNILLGADELRAETVAGVFNHIIREALPPSSITAAMGSVSEKPGALRKSYQVAKSLVERESTCSDTLITPNRLSGVLSNGRLEERIGAVLEMSSDSGIRAECAAIAEEYMAPYAGSLVSANEIAEILAIMVGQAIGDRLPGQVPLIARMTKTAYTFVRPPVREEMDAMVRTLVDFGRYNMIMHSQRLSPVVRLAVDFIDEDCASFFSIQDFCRRNGMNPTYFGYLFKKETGFLINDYLLLAKIDNACVLLLETDQKVVDIAERLGFSSPSYFIQCFKKLTGISPSKYRHLVGRK